MNRYLVGGILAVLTLLTIRVIGGNGGPSFAEERPVRDSPQFDVESLGTLPIDQAGRIVRRQGQATTTETPTAASDFSQVNGANSPGVAPNETIRQTITPNATRTDAFTTTGDIAPTAGNVSPAVGDISPLDPNQVQPGVTRPVPLPGDLSDDDLDSIPALW